MNKEFYKNNRKLVRIYLPELEQELWPFIETYLIQTMDLKTPLNLLWNYRQQQTRYIDIGCTE
jgi:hypothetical protein